MRNMTYCVLVLIVTFSGCIRFQPEPKHQTCDELLILLFRGNVGKQFENNRSLGLITQLHDVPKNDITIETYPEINEWTTVIRWQSNDIEYSLWEQDDQLKYILIDSTEYKLTTNRLIDCIGSQPTFYRALYGPRMERAGVDWFFELWFPSAGIVAEARGEARSNTQLPNLSVDTRISNIGIVQPDSVEKMYTSLGPGYLPFEDGYEINLWPNDWNDVKFTQGW